MVGSLRFRGGSAALVVGVALTLTACAGSRVPQPGAAAQAPIADMAPSQPAVAALPRVPDPAPNSAPPAEAQRLVGLKGDVLRGWIGNTMFIRRDGIAEIWRFAGGTCFLDVFLYREADGLRVAHLDARPRTGIQRITPQSCYGSILAERKAAPAPPS
jgi:hypothetical protein